MENIIKILLGEAELKEIGNATLNNVIRQEMERINEIIPAAEFEKGIDMIPEGTEMRRGSELALAYFGKYYTENMTYRDFYIQLKESEQLALSESIYGIINEFKNIFGSYVV